VQHDPPVDLPALETAAVVQGIPSERAQPLDDRRARKTEGQRGRLERWEIDGRIVLHDVAHNPDGLGALLGLGRALGPDGARLIALIGTAGDRRDEDLRSLGRVAGELADVVLTADKPRYLRDREAGELRALLAAGVREAGSRVTHLASELEGVETAWSGSRPGDVLALCVHEQRDEVEAWLREHGAAPLGG
jgi:cyanophycin synthetase